MNSAVDEKRRLRVELKARRARIARSEAAAASLAVRDRILRETVSVPATVVSGYWPMGDEFDIRPTLEALHARGQAIGLPVVLGRGRALVFRRWEPGDELQSGGFGTSVPGPDRAELLPDLMLVPLLGFDRRGYRLGYGGGYYDMTIAALRRGGPGVIAIGVGFAAQEVAVLPVEGFDQRLDAIATENSYLSIAEDRP